MTSITPYEFFYDAQQRRFLEQIVRAFSGFSYQTGMQDGQPPKTILVPCTMALTNKQVANIRANLSENTLNEVPRITIWQTGLRGRREDLQDPALVENLQVFERNVSDGKYGPNKGNAYGVERIMPLPFNMDVQVDVWTSNLEQKYQLIEQILVAMYPQFEIQNSENPLDWSAVTICFVEDDITFSSRSFPVGTTDDIDIFSIKLRIPIWLSAPAKVKKLSRIEEVVATVGDEVIDPIDNTPRINTVFRQDIVTPGDYCISVSGNVITLLSDKGSETLPDGSIPSWVDLLNLYGTMVPNQSQIRLMLTNDIEGPFASGTIQYGSEPNQLLWSLDTDTLPGNTLLPVDAVIDPTKTIPGKGLPTPVLGTRYMLIDDIGGPNVAWGNLSAGINDIIQYNGTSWSVVFDSSTTVTQQYVLNFYTGRQLRWDGKEWVMSIDTFYGPGYWRLAI